MPRPAAGSDPQWTRDDAYVETPGRAEAIGETAAMASSETCRPRQQVSWRSARVQRTQSKTRPYRHRCTGMHRVGAVLMQRHRAIRLRSRDRDRHQHRHQQQRAPTGASCTEARSARLRWSAECGHVSATPLCFVSFDIQRLLSRCRYWIASVRCAVPIRSSPSRSAIVRDTRSRRW